MHTWLVGTWLSTIKSINSIPRMKSSSFLNPGAVSQQDNGKTFSVSNTIRIPVERKDNGAALSCEASHQALGGQKRIRHYRLDVYCESLSVFSIHLRKRGCNRAFPAKHKCLCVSVAWFFRCMSPSEKQQKPRILKHNLDPNRASSVLCNAQCMNCISCIARAKQVGILELAFSCGNVLAKTQ